MHSLALTYAHSDILQRFYSLAGKVTENIRSNWFGHSPSHKQLLWKVSEKVRRSLLVLKQLFCDLLKSCSTPLDAAGQEVQCWAERSLIFSCIPPVRYWLAPLDECINKQMKRPFFFGTGNRTLPLDLCAHLCKMWGMCFLQSLNRA